MFFREKNLTKPAAGFIILSESRSISEQFMHRGRKALLLLCLKSDTTCFLFFSGSESRRRYLLQMPEHPAEIRRIFKSA